MRSVTALRAVLLASMTGAALCASAASRAADSPATSERIDRAISATYAAREFSEVAIAPDGRRVAWVERRVGADGVPDGHSDIFVADVGAPATPRRLTAASGGKHAAEGSLAWSPDSQRIAFLSDATKAHHSDIYLVAADGGTARRLTHADGVLAGLSWAPDGTRLGVLYTEHANRELGPLAAAAHETGEIKDVTFEQRFALVSQTDGRIRPVTADDLYVYEYTWAPKGEHIALIAARGDGDNNWWRAALYRQDLGGGQPMLVYKPTLQIASPAYAPDGQHIAFIEGLMSDQGSVGGDVYTVPAAGGAAENLTPGVKSSASSLRWVRGSEILVGTIIGGDTAIQRLDTATKQMTTAWRGPETVSTGGWSVDAAIAADGQTSAVIRSGFGTPPEILAGPLGEWRAITSRNASVRPAWGKSVSLKWKSDGYDVQGWLIYPADFDPAKRYPLVVDVHGGPGAAETSSWPGQGSTAMALAGGGYFILMPNPRGSFGQGEAFTRANVRDFGYGDLRDIQAGVDEALRGAPIDAGRIGMMGWSYGGFMTMWTVTQTARFKAAVAGAGIANWQSYYGQNKIDQWMVPFFGASVYDDPAVYAKSSPIQFIKNVKTPTLVLVGDSDAECPAPQSYEFWHALRGLGVDTRLVVYEHEGHHFTKPEHQKDRARRTIAWFDAYLR